MKTFYLFIIIHSTLLILNCFPQQIGWEIIPSGTNTQLNSVFFYDYEVGFDGTYLSTGIYFYKLQAGNYIKTNKMVLLK